MILNYNFVLIYQYIDSSRVYSRKCKCPSIEKVSCPVFMPKLSLKYKEWMISKKNFKNTMNYNWYLSIFRCGLSVCLFVCLIVSNKGQNGKITIVYNDLQWFKMVYNSL